MLPSQIPLLPLSYPTPCHCLIFCSFGISLSHLSLPNTLIHILLHTLPLLILFPLAHLLVVNRWNREIGKRGSYRSTLSVPASISEAGIRQEEQATIRCGCVPFGHVSNLCISLWGLLSRVLAKQLLYVSAGLDVSSRI